MTDGSKKWKKIKVSMKDNRNDSTFKKNRKYALLNKNKEDIK